MPHIHEQERSNTGSDFRPNLENVFAGSESASVRQQFVSESQEISNKPAGNEPDSLENKELPKLFIEGLERKSKDPVAQMNEAIREHESKYGIKTSTLGGENGFDQKPITSTLGGESGADEKPKTSVLSGESGYDEKPTPEKELPSKFRDKNRVETGDECEEVDDGEEGDEGDEGEEGAEALTNEDDEKGTLNEDSEN